MTAITPPSARADELPPGHCSIRATFTNLQDYLNTQLTTLLESFGYGAGGLVEYVGSELDVQHDDSTHEGSDGDLLRLTLTFEIPVIGRKHLYVDFFLRQTPDVTASPVCEYAQITSRTVQILDELRLCGEDDPPASCQSIGSLSYYVGPGVSASLISAAIYHEAYLDLTAGIQCERVFLEQCGSVNRWPNDLGPIGCSQSSSELAILCEEKHAIIGSVEIDPANFPGPLAVGVSDDFGVLGDFQIPGQEYSVRQYLENGGMSDQRLWRLRDPDPSNPNDVPDPQNPNDWELRTYRGKCYLQQLLQENLGSVLQTELDLGPNMQATFADIALAGGGVRISSSKRAIYFLIPSLGEEYDHEPDVALSDQPCTPRDSVPLTWFQQKLGDFVDAWEAAGASDAKPFLAITGMQVIAYEYVDFPKIAHHVLQSSALAAEVGLTVACNLGNDCANNGGDIDGDGFCDGGPNPDFCPQTPTSANCDWDGDGIGDGTTHLMGRPASPGLPALEPSCYGSSLPGFDSYGVKTRRRLMNFACGGCDNCGHTSNPDLWQPNPDVPHALDLPALFRTEDSLPVDPGTWQPDWDHDWVGDACDPDRDGDGLRNDFDCEPLNGALGIDLDGDGMCEDRASPQTDIGSGFDMQTCVDTCWVNRDLYQWRDPNDPTRGTPYVNTGDCVTGCWKGAWIDNCAPPRIGTDPWCDTLVSSCLPGDLSADDYAECSPDAITYCALQYANPGSWDSQGGAPAWFQPDGDGDGLGDKCDHGAFGMELIPSQRFQGTNSGPTARFGCNWIGGHYDLRMRAYGGQAIWPDEAQPPVYQSRTRTAFEVGACACNQDPSTSELTGDLDWLPECWDNTCPDNRTPHSVRGEEDNFGQKYWNPISDPGYAASHENGCVGVSCLGDEEHIQQSNDGNLIYGREQSFTRDESVNLLEVRFDWRNARQAWWPAGTDYEDAPDATYRASSSTPSLLTRVRSTWPDYQPSLTAPILYDYDPHRGVSYSDVTRVDERQGACYGEVYLGPPFVLAIIPGWVDPLGADGGHAWAGGLAAQPGPDGARLAATANVLGWNEAGDTLLLYRHGGDGFQLKTVQRFAGASVDPAATVSAAVGATDGAVWGLPAGERHQAVLVYQQPHEALSPDPTHGGGDVVAARLLLGRLSEGEVVHLEDVETYSGQATPSLHEGRVLLKPRGDAALVLGRAGSASGAWRLARLSLTSGTWTAPRRVALPATEQVLSANLDPVSQRVLVLSLASTEGESSGAGTSGDDVPPSRVLRARWLDPVTLAVTEAAPPSPPDLARSSGAVVHDPVLDQVWIAGGERDGAILDDVWRLDLGRRTWNPVAILPAPALRPLVSWDAARQMLWVAEHQADAAGLDVYAFSEAASSWTETYTALGARPPDWPVDDAYVAGRTYAYPYPVAETTDLPGEVILARLQSSVNWLSVEIRAAGGRGVSTGEVDEATGDRLAAALCPPGESCEVMLRARGASMEPSVPFTLDAESATLTMDSVVHGFGFARSLSGRGDRLYLAGPAGIRILRASTLDELGWIVRPGLFGTRVGAPCRGYLCVARPGPLGFKVVDVSRPEHASVVGRASLGRRAPRDLAVSGTRAFVALGRGGVRIVDLQHPRHPVLSATLAPGGKVISVAATDRLLATGRQDGSVALYELSSGSPVLVGTLQAGFRLSRVRFVANQLWVLENNARSAEAWRITDPAAPVRVGAFADHAAALTTGLWHGRRLFALRGHLLWVWRAE